MYILAIETTGAIGSVSLINQDGMILGSRECNLEMSHLQNLIPMIGELLDSVGVNKTEISFVAPSVGPGSFTGIRIGVATARGLCQGLGLSQGIAVPTLESFLYKEEAQKQEAIVCAIINARRGQVYGMIDGYLEPGPYLLTEVLACIKEKVLQDHCRIIFFGDGIDAYQKEIIMELPEGSYDFAEKSYRYQDAISVAKLAYEMYQEGNVVKYSDLLPEYMRKAEAEQKLEAGQLPICKGPKQE